MVEAVRVGAGAVRPPAPLSLIVASRQGGLLKGTLVTSFPAPRGAQSHSLPSGVHRSLRVTEARVRQTVLGTFSPSALGLVLFPGRQNARSRCPWAGREGPVLVSSQPVSSARGAPLLDGQALVQV